MNTAEKKCYTGEEIWIASDQTNMMRWGRKN